MKEIANLLLAWYQNHGRHDLPWQQNKTPYKVWLSEVMLQQTQVATVIDYFSRFIESLPTIESLANADQEQVLALWSGLGYYSRAKNLHQCAKQVVLLHNGQFPSSPAELYQLPGIGKTTAHAILSLAFNQPFAILDGNVKRVLTRIYALEGVPSSKEIENQLWHKAQTLMPSTQCAEYTQAIMDLGATLCKRSSPQCAKCPLQQHCSAKKQNRQSEFPTPKAKKTKPIYATELYIIKNSKGQIVLEHRQQERIWHNLWTLPGSSSRLFNKPTCLPKNITKTMSTTFRHTFKKRSDVSSLSKKAVFS